jgi:drug/metabolite transporter (DMT)-like permease
MLEAISWIAVVSVVEAFALFFIKQGGLVSAIKASLIFALAVVPLLMQAMKYGGIGLINFMWNIFSTVIGFGIGVYFFGEKIHGMQQVGIAICLLGLLIIEMAPKKDK